MSASATTPQPIITPLMFNSMGRQLMGVHHAPPSQLKRDIGILMCNQIGPDYTDYYKISRMLVNMLVAKGFDCLRFDYTGCGDSEGDFREISICHSLADIDAATLLFRQRCNCSEICLCGFGFGGTLAAAYAAAADVSALVLWEPIADGVSYYNLLRKRHKAWLRGSFVKATRFDNEFQAMGFPASTALEQEMRQVSLAGLATCRTRRVFVVTQDGSPDKDEIAQQFNRHGINVQSCATSTNGLPLRPMHAVAKWLEEGSE